MHMRLRKVFLRANALFAIVLAAVLAIMINYLAVKHRARFDLSLDGYFSLSGATTGMLGRLNAPVHAVVFLGMDHELFGDIRRLLREYEFASPRIIVEYVDPHRDLARAKELSNRYGVPGSGVVVFHAEGRTKIVPVSEVASYDYKPVLSGKPKVMVSFRGEQVFSSAIYSIMQEKKPVVYFLTGHGEQRIDDFGQNAGYSIIARLLEKANISVKTLDFAQAGAIPKDCDLLVIGGPKRPLTHVESEIVRKYIEDSGRLLLMADSGVETGLESLMDAWGVRLGNDRVVGVTLTGRELLVNNYGDHPVTERLKGLTTIFNLPRSVRPAASVASFPDHPADKPQVTVLASSSEDGWAEMTHAQNPPKFDAGVDQSGPVPVAVAVEKGNLPGDSAIRATRIVVIGDSTMVSNGALLSGYSPDFFVHAANWLLERPGAPMFAAKTPSRVRLNLDKNRLRLISATTTIVIPALVVLAGFAVSLRRRR